MVNSAARVWTTGGVVRATYPLPAFFAAASDVVSDPRVVFDPESQRWFASVVDVAHETVQIAVSKSSDPAGPWTVYSHATNSCPDQPSLGVSSNLVVVAYGAFASGCRSDPPPAYLGGALFAYDKQQLIDGAAAEASDWKPRADLSPVTAITLTTGPALAVALATPPALGGPTLVSILRLSAPSPASASLSMATASLPIRSLTPPPMAEQAGTTQTLDTNDVRILSAELDHGTLWLAGNDGCVPTGDTVLRSCLRIIGITRQRVTIDTDISQKNTDFFYPALAADQRGSLIIVHGYSSLSTYPSMAAHALLPDHHRTRALPIALGTAPHLADRFGDYFGAASDGNGNVWVTGEIGLSLNKSPNDWGTAIALVSVHTQR